jgi:lysophospholipase L1-like esterase
MNTIAVWGDSITRGALDETEGGWVSRLRKHVNGLGGMPKILNLGINGEKISDVLGRFKREYDDLEHPDVVIFAIGINDSPHAHYKGTNLEDFNKKYEQLIHLAIQRADKIILVGLTNVIDKHASNHGYSNDHILKYNDLIKKLAIRHNLIFVDLWEVVTESDLKKDGLHPEEEGHEKIYKKASKALAID